MTSITQHVQQQTSVTELVEANYSRFDEILPGHIKAKLWVAVAVGAIRRDPNLMEAANNDPRELMVALLDAARKGLEPGTETYYLVPRKKGGRKVIQGMEGYQGIVERMYRSGRVSSVRVQTVRKNDRFAFDPARDPQPRHEIDWFGDRGELVGVYAYAIMHDGAPSQVVVLNKAQVMEAKAKSDGASSSYSPWNQGEGEAMWLKTAARRLSKWVPTSNEDYRAGTGQALPLATVRVDSQAVESTPEMAALPAPPPVPAHNYPEPPEGCGDYEPAVGGGDEGTTNPPTPTAPNPDQHDQAVEVVADELGGEEMVTAKQLAKMGAMFGEIGVTTRDERLDYVRSWTRNDVTSANDLTKREASQVIDNLQREIDRENTQSAPVAQELSIAGGAA